MGMFYLFLPMYMSKAKTLADTIYFLTFERSKEEGLRLAYGNKTNQWHFINKKDRDFQSAITCEEAEKLSPEQALGKYLAPVPFKA
ncbi:MAG: hypothetical protein [Siphoviridae sp. ctpQM7]|nr:MAG: hypothetical protein [Siphoviridae sp. ctpQM7]